MKDLAPNTVQDGALWAVLRPGGSQEKATNTRAHHGPTKRDHFNKNQKRVLFSKEVLHGVGARANTACKRRRYAALYRGSIWLREVL